MTDDPETTPEDTTESSRRMDPELKSISAILRELNQLDEAARGCVVRYLASRYEEAKS